MMRRSGKVVYKNYEMKRFLRRAGSACLAHYVNNLWKRDIESLFRFVTDPEVDPTNNISERELRIW